MAYQRTHSGRNGDVGAEGRFAPILLSLLAGLPGRMAAVKKSRLVRGVVCFRQRQRRRD